MKAIEINLKSSEKFFFSSLSFLLQWVIFFDYWSNFALLYFWVASKLLTCFLFFFYVLTQKKEKFSSSMEMNEMYWRNVWVNDVWEFEYLFSIYVMENFLTDDIIYTFKTYGNLWIDSCSWINQKNLFSSVGVRLWVWPCGFFIRFLCFSLNNFFLRLCRWLFGSSNFKLFFFANNIARVQVIQFTMLTLHVVSFFPLWC